MTNYSYVTLLSSDDYYPGVIMLYWSLKSVNSMYPLTVLCSDGLSEVTIKKLRNSRFPFVLLEDHWRGTEEFNKEAGYEHWENSFDKLFVWTLTQFDKIVLLDADMQVIKNIDFLFSKPHMSAVRADEWNDSTINHLNSGLMVIEPNSGEFDVFCSIWGSQRGKWGRNLGDQDIIRAAFPEWGNHRELSLPYGLNVFYSEVSRGVIKKEDVSPVSVIHYIGSRKPWMLSPMALWRRSRNNFLGKHLLRYAFSLWGHFPKSLFNGI